MRGDWQGPFPKDQPERLRSQNTGHGLIHEKRSFGIFGTNTSRALMGRELQVLLSRLFNAGAGFGQLVREHDRAPFKARIERDEPRFAESREIRAILQ